MAKSSTRSKAAADTSSLNEGPICVVCGDKANGMHYRALTCEGCKTFFRRNARNHLSLKCEMGGEKSCEMDLYTRRHCAACRMKKCLDMGMQIDRLWDKERLKTRKPITKKSGQPTDAERAPAETPSKKKPETSVKKEKNVKPTCQELADLVTNAYMMAASQLLPHHRQQSPCGSGSPGTESHNQEENINDESASSDHAATVPAVGTSHLPVPQQLPQSSPETSTCTSSLAHNSSLSARISSGLKAVQMPEGFGEISESLFVRALDVLLGLLKHMINFAKALPGFQSLETEDQATLIKGSFLEYIIISSATLYNPETKTFESELWPEENWNADKLHSVGFRRILESVLDVVNKVQKLQPSRTEMTLLYAISIFTPDRKDLSNTVEVEALQQKLLQSLRYVVEERHKGSVGHFAKLIMLLTDVKNVTDVMLEDVLSIQLQGAVLSPIMMEMFSM
ncbi:Vitamin D3 receptor B [Holothuria leucospilota]|uniref:Vitamin D3 receptor B n=1 Tax=Holothuria leucospilota TaxID=206669 RepID=A0A9Q1H6E7_HOLLE|nr:Vitamin D3 receptor B [Holothuria leucospilota]